MELTVVRAEPAQRDLLAQLLEFNAYEFSRIDGRSVGSDGRFGYRYLDLYWSDVGRVPYVIWVGGEVAGLVLVRADDAESSIAEFLVLPRFRRGGLGTRAAREVLARHPGRWRVSQVAGNDSATAFWRRAIPVPFDEVVEEGGDVVQQFTT